MRISSNAAYLLGGGTALAGVAAGTTGLLWNGKHKEALAIGSVAALLLGGYFFARNVSAATVHWSADVLMASGGLAAGLGVSELAR